MTFEGHGHGGSDGVNAIAGVPIDATDFEILDLAPRFRQDRATLDARWKALQAKVHPDRFAADSPAARLRAMEWAIRVNEAYRRLRDPIERAAYLCRLNGEAVDAGNNTAMASAFLMQQMEWREALAEAGTPAAVEMLKVEVAARRKVLDDALERSIDVRQDWCAAGAQVRELMFVARFAQDVDQRLEAFEPGR